MAKKRTKLEKLIKLEILFLIPLLILSGIVLYKEYNILPGLIQANALEIKDKTADSVSLKWKPVRNADKYIVSYKEKDSNDWKTTELSGDVTEYTISELKEGIEYDFTLRADSEEKSGSSEAVNTTTTKKRQTIEGKKKQMKLAGTRKIDLDSETEITLTAENEDVATVNKDQTVELSPGTTTIKAEATETDDFEKEETEIEVEVLDSVSEETDKADVHILYKLNESNCEKILTLKSSDIPQSFDYKDGKYIISYGMENARTIVTYDEEGKSEIKTETSLEHPNGFAVSDKGYSVRGWSSECVAIDLKTGECEKFNLPYGASGIAYDKKKNMFYSSSVPTLASYDKDFNKISAISPITHKGNHYTQDCGGYNGILMRCISGSSRHETNYVDLYDMVNGLYLGSAECDLSEVESAAVDDEGYMLLLCNYAGDTDYVYKTPINIEDIGKDINDNKPEEKISNLTE